MARTSKIILFISIRSPLTSDKTIFKYWFEAANEFFQFWNKREIILFGKKRRVSAENIDPPKRILNRIKNQRTFYKNLPGHWGKLSCLVKQEDVVWLGKEWAGDKNAPDPSMALAVDLAFLDFTDQIMRSLISSNIATIGAISLLDGAGIAEPNYFRYYEGSGINNLDEILSSRLSRNHHFFID